MKKLVLLLFISISSFAQETEFKFTKDGITDYLVIPIEGKTASELYSQTLNWISKTYNEPDNIIKAKIENDYIRISAQSKNLIVFNQFGKSYYNARYQIEISFQDGKYKFDVISVDLLNTQSKPEMPLTDMSEYYKPDGKLKNNYKYYPESFTNFFNTLNNELKSYLIQDNKSKKKDW